LHPIHYYRISPTASLNHYHEFYPSDHRPIYLGIEPTFFGALPALVAQQFRYINSNSKLVGEFVTIIYQHLLDKGTFQRMSTMTIALPECTPSQIQSMASSIDEQVTRALLSAERKCKRPPGEPWSEALHFASLHVKYWRLKLSAQKNNYNATSTLATIPPLLLSTCQIVDDGALMTQQSLNAAKRHRIHQWTKAKVLRVEFLQELRERIALRKTSSTLDPAKALKCISKQLRQTVQYGHIKSVLRPSTQDPLTKVHVTTQATVLNPDTGLDEIVTHVEVIDTRAELEARILARNKRHFAQAQGTPFTEEPLRSMTADNALDLLDPHGDPIVLPPGTFRETSTVLDIIREAFESRPASIQATVTFDDFITSFLHWNEKTSTSPSGRHLGLYKSLVTAHCDSGSKFRDTDDGLSIQEKSTAILQLIHGLATCVAERGLYLEWWIVVVNVMIYKKAGLMELDELRVIHLFEADFNLLVSTIFGHRTVHNAVNSQKLHPSQFGRKGGECMDAEISQDPS
jgi:hypothetical protein